jgi:hypothetical protein
MPRVLNAGTSPLVMATILAARIAMRLPMIGRQYVHRGNLQRVHRACPICPDAVVNMKATLHGGGENGPFLWKR